MPNHPPTATDFDLRATLTDVKLLAEQALEAMDDEREGDFTRAIVEIHTHAAACLHLVNTW